MKKILADAANIGVVTAPTKRTIAYKIRDEDAYFYPNSGWRLPFFGGSTLSLSLKVTRAQFSDMLRMLESKRLKDFHFTVGEEPMVHGRSIAGG